MWTEFEAVCQRNQMLETNRFLNPAESQMKKKLERKQLTYGTEKAEHNKSGDTTVVL